MSNTEEVIFVDVDCECECAPTPKKHHHHKEEPKVDKVDKEVEKVVPEKEALKDSAPDVTVKLTKEEVAKELDDRDGHTVHY